MKAYLTLIFITLMFSAQAQEFRVISMNGEAYKKGGTTVKLYPGASLSLNDTLVLNAGTIKILDRDRPILLEEAKTYLMQELYEVHSRKSMSFTSRFWNFVADGLKSSDSGKDLKSYQVANLSVSGGIKGYSEGSCSERGISVSSPVTGLHPKGDLTVSWEGSIPVDRIIFSHKKDSLVEVELPTSPFVIDLAEVTQDYKLSTLHVTLEFEGCQIQKIIEIRDVDETAMQDRLSSIAGVDAQDEKTLQWSKSIVLEMQGQLNASLQALETMNEDYPDDPLLERLYYLFQARNNPDYIIPNNK